MKKLVLVMGVVVAWALQAAYYTDLSDWICNTNTSQEGQSNNSWYRDTCSAKVSCWAGGVWAESGKKYMISKSRMRTPTKGTTDQTTAGIVKFPGDVLAIDGDKSNLALLTKDLKTQIDDFRWCQGGICSWSGGTVNLTGGIGVFAAENAPFGASGQTETINIYSSVSSGVQRAGLKFYCEQPTDPAKSPCTFRLLGDCSKYTGTVSVINNSTLALGCPVLPADLIASYDGSTPAAKGTGRLTTSAAAGASVTVDSVTIDSGAELILQATNTLVTTDLTLKKDAVLTFVLNDKAAGNATFLRVENKPTLATPVKGEVTMAAASEANCGMAYVLVEAPEGSFAEGDFDLTVSAKNLVGDPVGSVSVKTEGGKSKLILTCRPALITLKATDGAAHTQNLNSSFTNAANWEASVSLPEKAPIQAGYDYGVITPAGLKDHLVLRTPEVSSTKVALAFPKFLGDSLTLQGSSSKYAMLSIRQYELEIPRLVMRNNSFLYLSDVCDVTVKGRIEMPDESAAVRIEAYSGTRGRKRNMDAELVGSSQIIVTGRGGSGMAAGNLNLNALNTNFTGRIKVTCPSVSNTDPAKVFPQHLAGYYEILKFADIRNLGSRPEMDTQGIWLEQMSALNPLSTMTLAKSSNRGVFVSGEGTFLVTNVDFTVETPITYAGVARKEGNGTLVLAGKALFIDGKEATLPLKGTNVLNVVEGAVKPLSADCLDGVKMVFADGTRLVYDLNPTGEGMLTTGPVNTKEPDGTPLAIAEGATMTKIPVELTGTPSTHVATIPLGTFTDAATAASVRDLLDVRRPKGHSVALAVVGNTVVANVEPKGLMLLIK